MFRPDFIHTDEDWVIWLLGSEFHGHASPQQILERTHLDGGQVEEVVRNLERIKAVRVVRIPGRFPPENIATVGLQKTGFSVFEGLKQANDIHDL
ncbi:MAG TPA: hypothetical protein VMS89_09670 [Methanoregulaceae archaeon]|nr:hypothetical protein [Methanoregulaceae archaeon]